MTERRKSPSPARATRWDRRARRTSAARRPQPVHGYERAGRRSADVIPSGTGSLTRPRPPAWPGSPCASVVALARRREHRGFHRLPGGRKRRVSWPAGRCEAGMAMTRSVAMLAAIATAIERRRLAGAQRAAPQLAEHGGRFDRREFPAPPAWPGRRPGGHVALLAAEAAEWLQGRSFRRQSRTPSPRSEWASRPAARWPPVRAARNTPGNWDRDFLRALELLILIPALMRLIHQPRGRCRLRPSLTPGTAERRNRVPGSARQQNRKLRSSCSASG